MDISASAQFRNLDVVLRSTSDMGALARHLDRDERVIVLSHQEFNGEHVLALELNAADLAEDAPACTRQFLAIIEGFPDAALAVWRGCTSRSFSYGFDGGSNSAALDMTIAADLLLRIAQIGADIGITVYPHRDPDAD